MTGHAPRYLNDDVLHETQSFADKLRFTLRSRIVAAD